VDVGPLVVADAQTPELVEPRKRPLHDPPPPAEATPVRGAAHGQQGRDVTSPETAPNGGHVVAAIPEHTVRLLPRSPAFPVQRGNRIHQRQGVLRVVLVRAVRRTASGTPPSRRGCPVPDASSIADLA
jgi:hypothetical protein